MVAPANAIQTPTYGIDGSVLESPCLFKLDRTRSTETLANDGLGNPVANDISTGLGLVQRKVDDNIPVSDYTVYPAV
jgi:meiotically up-regulated gene 157 (Mug157) protein